MVAILFLRWLLHFKHTFNYYVGSYFMVFQHAVNRNEFRPYLRIPVVAH